MNTLSVNSVSNIYVRTAVAQQRVSVDRGNVRETEAQLSQYQAKLDEDLTYLAKLQRKNHDLQQLEGNQAQTPILERIDKDAQSAAQASAQASATLSAITSSGPTVGTNINIVA
jgi:TolA-binding protein